MVSSAELAVLGTLAGTLITGSISLVNNKIRQESESNRRYGEIFLEKKVDRLVNLHDSFKRSENKVDRLKMQKTDEKLALTSVDESEVGEEIDNAIMNADQAHIFLDENQAEILEDGLIGLSIIFMIYSDEDYGWENEIAEMEENQRESIEETMNMLKNIIDNPSEFN